ncbi:hypothetical protein QMZ93_07450 [Pantoea stewartii subsp. indologenes]|uniref:hypothetical protein n=1 Tax=Pantoea stewartii TaxID=66269 RepID=UPI0024E022FF|nr:hypothetical protein [Pantoea stewartii]MDK2633178.1 hypothetical protein [Pantoea stewartii subsp. indologenes]
MTLKYQLTAEEFAQLEEGKQALYLQQGEVYQLQVDGIPQEDVSGLKRQRDELLAEKKAEQERRRAAEEQAQREADERARAEGNYQQLFESSQAELERERSSLTELRRSIEQRDINLAATRVATAIADGSNAEILTEFIARRLKVAEGQVRITDESGNLTVSSLADLQKEFETSPRYASLVRGSQAGGGGAAPKSGDRVAKKWEELRGMERVELRKNNPAEYERLKKAHEATQ